MKNILVAGSSGFICSHLTERLIKQGYHVVGVDLDKPKPDMLPPHEFYQADLRDQNVCDNLLSGGDIDTVMLMACIMGGLGYIGDPKHDYDIMVGSSAIVSNLLQACVHNRVENVFYPSSACVYPLTRQEGFNSEGLREKEAIPSEPDLTYGWQKLFGEKQCEASRVKGLNVRIARFFNVYGPHTIYDGGKEKYPAALCRKVAMAKDGDEIEVWGSGTQQRTFMYVDDCVDGIMKLMAFNDPPTINMGSTELVTVNELAGMVIRISGKSLRIKNVKGAEGVQSRQTDNTLCKKILDWEPQTSLLEGMTKLYHYVNKQING